MAETEVSWLSLDDALECLGVGLQGYAPPAAGAGRTGRGRKTVCHSSVSQIIKPADLSQQSQLTQPGDAADSEAAAADNVYPTEQILQSTVAVSQSVAPDPAAIVGVPFGQVHILATQVGTDFHCKSEPQTVVPEPDHPGSHVTMIRSSIVPTIESVAALLECKTCVGGQTF